MPNKTDNKQKNNKKNKNKDAVQNKSGDIETGKAKPTLVSTGLDATNHSIIPDGEVLDVDDVEHDTTCAICLVDYGTSKYIGRIATVEHHIPVVHSYRRTGTLSLLNDRELQYTFRYTLSHCRLYLFLFSFVNDPHTHTHVHNHTHGPKQTRMS